MPETMTAFRVAEKKYKAYKDPKGRGFKHTDYSEVVDFRNLDANTAENFSRILVQGRFRDRDAYALTGHDGLIVIPNALSEAEQIMWLQRSAGPYLCNNPQTNLRTAPTKSGVLDAVDPHSPEGLSRLRWATLGRHFHWTERKYDADGGQFPQELADFTAEISTATGNTVHGEAAIVNYFHTNSAMCGHIDDSEEDLSKPIVSLSCGLTAVFLIGGRSHDITPTALFIRSGDVVIMGGESRLCVHGVPRVIDGSLPEFLAKAVVSWEDVPLCVKDFFSRARVNINVRQVISNQEHLA